MSSNISEKLKTIIQTLKLNSHISIIENNKEKLYHMIMQTKISLV